MEISNPKVSIITVVLNDKGYIEETINSVLGQSYNNLEYVIVDGGSTDGTLDIIKKYEDKVSTIISEKDNGIYDAMNKGITMAKGELVGIINSGDWYESNAVELIVDRYRSDKNAIYHGILKYYLNDKEYYLRATNHEALKNEQIEHPTCFIPKSVYEKCGLYLTTEYKIASDYELLLRNYLKGTRFVQINSLIANFRLTGISTKQNELSHIEKYRIQLSYNLISKKTYIIYKYRFLFKQFLKSIIRDL